MEPNTLPAQPPQPSQLPTAPPSPSPTPSALSLDQFLNLIQLRTAKIARVEVIPNKDKLYHLTLEVGTETRTIVSGIRTFFPNPEDLVGKNIIILANLEPKKLGGVVSEGMLLAAEDDEGNFALLVPEKPVKSGTRIR